MALVVPPALTFATVMFVTFMLVSETARLALVMLIVLPPPPLVTVLACSVPLVLMLMVPTVPGVGRAGDGTQGDAGVGLPAWRCVPILTCPRAAAPAGNGLRANQHGVERDVPIAKRQHAVGGGVG